jgi:hypothetical protein
MSLQDVAEWISMERLCCPFLTFQLETSGSEADYSLRVSGPTGVKDLLRAEFPGDADRDPAFAGVICYSEQSGIVKENASRCSHHRGSAGSFFAGPAVRLLLWRQVRQEGCRLLQKGQVHAIKFRRLL